MLLFEKRRNVKKNYLFKIYELLEKDNYNNKNINISIITFNKL